MKILSGKQVSGSIGRRGLLAFSVFLISVVVSPFSVRADSNANAIVNLAGIPSAYNGTNVVVGQLENGTPTNNVTDFNTNNILGSMNLNGTGVGNHATEVASEILSTGVVTSGTAPGAQLYSVSGLDEDDFVKGMLLLANQQNARVINVSAGFPTVTNVRTIVRSGGGTTVYFQPVQVSNANGTNLTSLAEDNLVQKNGVTFVVATGNSGVQGSNSFNEEASAYNIISVGAVSNTTAKTTSLGDLSSHGYLVNGRAGVDLVAPGVGMIMNGFATNVIVKRTLTYVYSNNTGTATIYLPGSTGSYLSGAGPAQTTLSRVDTNSGTSFAAPIVTGVAADLISAAQSGSGVFTSPVVSADAQDPRIIKAALMNSATKLAGWTQNAITNKGGTGPIEVMQSLDPNQGAGLLNAGGSYLQLAAGEQGMTVRGGTAVTNSQVNLNGWALEGVTLNLTNLYQLNQKVGGGTLYATLDWYRQTAATITATKTNFTDQGLDNLDLILLSSANSTFTSPSVYAETLSNTVDNVQQLYFTNLPAAYYELGVYFASNINDSNSLTSVSYGLAWATTIPEPSSFLLAGLGLTALWWQVRQRRRPH